MSDVRAAESSIRRFSQALWVVGTIAVGIIGVLVFPRIWMDPATGEVFVENDDPPAYGATPWLEDDPQLLQIEDGAIEGDERGGYLPFPSDAAPLMLTRADDAGDLLGVRQGLTDPLPRFDLPARLGYLWDGDDVVYAVPAESDGRLWFSTDVRAWRLQATPLSAEPIGTTHSGTGDATLEYEGDALSARFTHEGTGIFRVTIVSPGENQLGVNEVDDVNVTASWNTAGRVLFIVDAADASGTWTVTVHE